MDEDLEEAIEGLEELEETAESDRKRALIRRTLARVREAAGLAAVIALLYGTKFRRVEVVNPILGFLPRRVVGITAAAFVTSFALMAGWGRVDWGDPRPAWGQITFLAVVMAVGAAISDIIPAE